LTENLDLYDHLPHLHMILGSNTMLASTLLLRLPATYTIIMAIDATAGWMEECVVCGVWCVNALCLFVGRDERHCFCFTFYLFSLSILGNLQCVGLIILDPRYYLRII